MVFFDFFFKWLHKEGKPSPQWNTFEPPNFSSKFSKEQLSNATTFVIVLWAETKPYCYLLFKEVVKKPPILKQTKKPK